MKLKFALLSATLLISACAISINPNVTGKILTAGLCEHGPAARYDQPQSTAGYATISSLRITEQTTVVPLRKDIGFGFTWQATGILNEAGVEFLIHHPNIIRQDGKTMDGFSESLPVNAQNGVVTSTDCYILSEYHELVAGKWTIAVAYKGRTLVS